MDNEIKETDMNNLPKDPVMLLSVVNTNLRDFYSNLDEFCKAKDADKQEIIEKLKMIQKMKLQGFFCCYYQNKKYLIYLLSSGT